MKVFRVIASSFRWLFKLVKRKMRSRSISLDIDNDGQTDVQISLFPVESNSTKDEEKKG